MADESRLVAELRELLQDTRKREDFLLQEAVDNVKAVRQVLEGHNGNPGLTLRVDRLEQQSKSMGRIVAWIANGGLGAFGIFLFDLFTKR